MTLKTSIPTAAIATALVAIAGQLGVHLTQDEAAGAVALVFSVVHLAHSSKGRDWRAWLQLVLSGPGRPAPTSSPSSTQTVQAGSGVSA